MLKSLTKRLNWKSDLRSGFLSISFDYYALVKSVIRFWQLCSKFESICIHQTLLLK